MENQKNLDNSKCIGCVWFKVGCNGYPNEIAECQKSSEREKSQRNHQA